MRIPYALRWLARDLAAASPLWIAGSLFCTIGIWVFSTAPDTASLAGAFLLLLGVLSSAVGGLFLGFTLCIIFDSVTN